MIPPATPIRRVEVITGGNGAGIGLGGTTVRTRGAVDAKALAAVLRAVKAVA